MPLQQPSTEAHKPKILHELAEEDIIRLLNPEHATEARMTVAARLSENYQSTLLKKEEAIVAEQIFRLLVRDTELDMRKQLSQSLKTSTALPRDIALTMAADITDVALPILECSTVLTELDLIDLINNSPDTAKHVAIAKREVVPERVVGTLLDQSGASEVAYTLAQNAGAALNEEAMQMMIERHSHVPQVMDVLATRPALPATIAEKVIAHVSEQLKIHVAKTYQVGAEVLAEQTLQSREAATLSLIRNNISDIEMQKLVEQLMTFERLTPSLLIAALAQGYVAFFVISMATLGNVPIENALTLMRDKGGLGFRALYNKLGLPMEYFATMRDILPHAVALKDSMSALEGQAFANALSRHLKQDAAKRGVTVDHLIKIIENSGR